MSAIIRIHGEAAPLIWTHRIDDAIRAVRFVRLLESDARQDEHLHRRFWSSCYHETRENARSVFAAAQGWKPEQRGRIDLPIAWGVTWQEWSRFLGDADASPFWPTILGNRRAPLRLTSGERLDHPEFFRSQRKIKALIVHNYGKLPDGQIPSNLVIDRLPDSWYWPGHTTAYCIRPAPLHARNQTAISNGAHEFVRRGTLYIPQERVETNAE
jgi:hypothetical protein